MERYEDCPDIELDELLDMTSHYGRDDLLKSWHGSIRHGRMLERQVGMAERTVRWALALGIVLGVVGTLGVLLFAGAHL